MIDVLAGVSSGVAVAAALAAAYFAHRAGRIASRLSRKIAALDTLAAEIAALGDAQETTRTMIKRITSREAKRRERADAETNDGRPDPEKDPEGWRRWAVLNHSPLHKGRPQ